MVKYLGAAVDKVLRQEHRELMKAEAGWPERNQVWLADTSGEYVEEAKETISEAA